MISETPTTATPCDMEIAPETNTGDEAVSSFDATNGNESGSSFDATTFTSMILESQDFVDTVKRRMEEGVKVCGTIFFIKDKLINIKGGVVCAG